MNSSLFFNRKNTENQQNTVSWVSSKEPALAELLRAALFSCNDFFTTTPIVSPLDLTWKSYKGEFFYSCFTPASLMCFH